MKLNVIIILVIIDILLRIKKISSNNTLVSCLNNLLDKHSHVNKQKILSNLDVKLKHPIFKLKPGTPLDKKLFCGEKFDIVIVNGRYINIASLLSKGNFNPNASYIVLTNIVSEEIFEQFSKLYISKVYLIDDDLSIFSYSPYAYENVGNPDTTPMKIGHCSNITTNFQIQLPKYWRNTTLRVAIRLLAPYTREDKNGLENRFIELLNELMGVKIEYIILQRQNYECEMEPLSIEGAKLLQQSSADVLIGFNSPNASTLDNFEVSGWLYFDSVAWISPNSLKIGHWNRISKIFSKKSLICLVVLVILWILIARAVHKNVNVFELALMIHQILLEQSISKTYLQINESRHSFRIMFSSWMIAFLVISTLFKNSLLVILGTEKRTPQLLFTKNIFTTDLKMSSYINLTELYMDHNNKKEYQIDFDKIESCESVLECVNKTAFQRNSITTAPKTIVRYNWIPKYYITDNGEVLVTVSRDPVKSFSVHLIFSKGYPLFERVNQLLIWTSASGWFVHTYEEMRMTIKRATSPLVFEAKKIGMNKFSFVFVIWIGGLVISVAVFLAEICLIGKKIPM